MFCPNCGKEISDTAKVCGYCGQPQQTQTKPTVNKPRADGIKKASKTSSPPLLGKVPVLIWGIGAILGLILLIWLISSGSMPGTTEGNSIVGQWIAVDLDGSKMRMRVQQTSDGVYSLERYDEVATTCEGKSATGVSNGYEDSPNTILATGSFSCENGKNLGVYTVAFHYESAADRIREETPDSGVFIFWERAN